MNTTECAVNASTPASRAFGCATTVVAPSGGGNRSSAAAARIRASVPSIRASHSRSGPAVRRAHAPP